MGGGSRIDYETKQTSISQLEAELSAFLQSSSTKLSTSYDTPDSKYQLACEKRLLTNLSSDLPLPDVQHGSKRSSVQLPDLLSKERSVLNESFSTEVKMPYIDDAEGNGHCTKNEVEAIHEKVNVESHLALTTQVEGEKSEIKANEKSKS